MFIVRSEQVSITWDTIFQSWLGEPGQSSAPGLEPTWVDNSQNSINKYIFSSTVAWANQVVEQTRSQRLTTKE